MKKIELTQGKYALVDDADFEWLNQWRWYYHQTGYAWRKQHLGMKDGRQVSGLIRMHRLIMDNPESLEIDHVDGNGLNNQRSNLRIATHAQNMRNKKRRSDNTSGFIGVYWHKQNQRWYARILGSHPTAAAAAQIYNQAAIKHLNGFARLN